MQTRVTEISPHSFRFEIEAPWETVEPDYCDACAVYRNVSLPGFRPGHVPPTVIAEKFGKEICRDAAARCAARLTRDALREKNIRTIGGIAITEAVLTPRMPFRCAAELTRRPPVTLPDYANFIPGAHAGADNAGDAGINALRDEISDWLLSHTHCEVPEKIIRENLAADGITGAQPGTPDWEEAEQNARLLLITREIAEHEGITPDERRLQARLAAMAADAGISVQTFRANLEAAGHLDSLRDFLLAEEVLDYLAARQTSEVLAQ